MCIERKTFDDLHESLNDNRFQRQKTQMLANFTRNLYWVEGDLSGSYHNWGESKRQMSVDALLATQAQGFELVRARCIDHTAELLREMTAAMIERPLRVAPCAAGRAQAAATLACVSHILHRIFVIQHHF